MLYRGECRYTYLKNGGRIFPRNMYGAKEVVARADGKARADGRFKAGPSEKNRVEAHQIETGLYGGCSVSTTRSRLEAERFALYGDDEGVVYWIDDSQFERYGVVAFELENPAIPSEQEVTLRAENGGEIPAEVIVKVEFVKRS
ncbi:hypothetical protein [Pseudomonas viridiflava]|uniref:hypothetical protein n=1 Tax=Pseudomonas viridiflava TaxID=33069 RepID=UPI000F0726E8|nr:hypothetical protein [Pseudomonas viridiflava]